MSSSPGSKPGSQPASQPSPPQSYRGQAIGLPQTGAGSLAPTGPRLLAFIVDALASTLIAALFVPRHAHTGNAFADRLPGTWSLIPLAVDYLVGSLVAGRTIGMYLLGLRLIRTDPSIAVGPGRALGARCCCFCSCQPSSSTATAAGCMTASPTLPSFEAEPLVEVEAMPDQSIDDPAL